MYLYLYAYKRNNSLHKINLWFILQYVNHKEKKTFLTRLKSASRLFYNNVQMYSEALHYVV